MDNINNIIMKLKKKIINNISCDDLSGLVKVATGQDLEVITNLFKVYGKDNSVYSEDELMVLRNYNVPKRVVDFYQGFRPISSIDLGADVILLSLEEIKVENTELAPGALLIKYGLLTIASTTGGNAICLDLNRITNEEPRIVIADSTIFSSQQVTIFKEGIMINEELSYEVIQKYVIEINKTFTGFLEMIINDEINDIEDFLE